MKFICVDQFSKKGTVKDQNDAKLQPDAGQQEQADAAVLQPCKVVYKKLKQPGKQAPADTTEATADQTAGKGKFILGQKSKGYG